MKESSNVTVDKAIECLNSHDDSGALNLFEQAIKENPSVPELLYGKALALARLGRMDDAVTALAGLITQRPEHQGARELIKVLEVELAGKKSAPSDQTESSPDVSIEDLMNMASAALSENNPQKALNYLIESKRLKGHRRNQDYLRALAFIKLGKIGDARESLLEELRHYEDNKEAKELLEEVLKEESSREWCRAQNREPEFTELLQQIRPFSMLPEARLYNLYRLARDVCLQDIPGNFVECGVAGGGSSAMLAAVIKRHSKRPRLLYACDTFEGMPPPGEHDTLKGQDAESTGWGTGTCAAPPTSLEKIAGKLGVFEQIIIVKGLFQETLPLWKTRMGELAFVHMDADWYESTVTIFDNLYPRMVTGARVQLDDYNYWEGIKKAVDYYQTKHNLKFEICDIDGMSAWFIKK
ncbi:MAG: hypothetical protein D6719_09755 [Candidatus Dadabacteria bacterium]|nr:MAG: hypothetical protein D6719_09755 [Candidatus Dadabacteria bacterium]